LRILVVILLLLGIHFAGTVFVPGPVAQIYWPFGENSRPLIAGIGGLPKQRGSVIAPLLGGVAVLGFVAALLALFGVLVPPEWFRPLVIAGSVAALLLHLLFFSPVLLPAMVVDLVLLAGALLVRSAVLGLGGA
jgi:hypothetical protein